MSKYVLVFVGLLFVISSAMASGRSEFSLKLGAMTPVGSVSGISGANSPNIDKVDISAGGVSFGASYFYWLGQNWAMGLEGAYAPSVTIDETYEYNSILVGTIPLKGSSSVNLFQVMPGIKIGSRPDPNKKGPAFYFMFLFGMYGSGQDTAKSFSGTKTEGGSTESVTITDVPGYTIESFGIAPGFGLSWALSPSVNMSLDIRYHILSQDGVRFLNPMLNVAF